jgi:hypothetical protein
MLRSTLTPVDWQEAMSVARDAQPPDEGSQWPARLRTGPRPPPNVERKAMLT